LQQYNLAFLAWLSGDALNERVVLPGRVIDGTTPHHLDRRINDYLAVGNDVNRCASGSLTRGVCL
jgi:hypothetical protein